MENIGEILNNNKRRWTPSGKDLFKGSPKRPLVKPTRFYIDNEYFKEGYGEMFNHSITAIYCVLAMHANHTTQTCFPSADTIMKYAGITNRNTVFEGFKVLEAFQMIAVIHRSNGRVPNVYKLVDSKLWRPCDSINYDTVRKQSKRVKKEGTVSNSLPIQSPNLPINSTTDDTQTHLNESNKENHITSIEEKVIKEIIVKEEIFVGTLIMLKPYYKESDILTAYSVLQDKGLVKPGFSELKNLLKQWTKEGKITSLQNITW